MSLDLRSDISIRNQWARVHATRGIKELLNEKLNDGLDPSQRRPFLPDEPLPPLPHRLPSYLDHDRVSKTITNPKVAIVGAGATGLFTAMILDYLNKKLKQKGFEISYEIFEAASKDRIGGRLFTYNFIAQDERNPAGQHDYYDVGAMRFPKNKVMTRLFDLFHHLGMKMKDVSDPTPPPLSSLVPYYIQNIKDNGAPWEPWCFNNITKWGGYKYIAAQAQDSDPFNFRQNISTSILKQSPDDTFNKTVENVREKLREDLDTTPPGNAGWNLLMSYDKLSTRQFLGVSQQDPSATTLDPTLPPFPYDTIEFLETFNGGTNWYDQAHSETVLESLDFEYEDDSTENKWWAILGGATQLALKMEETLTTKPSYLSRVTAIRVGEVADMEIDIKRPACGWDTDPETRTYNGVFNTTTLSCLKRIDTTGTNLNYSTVQAIRSLGYGPSAKVGIKFARPWWIYDLPTKYQIKKGGLGHSDLSIRTCVYPSYNICDPADEPAVLLCSYTWQQDAERLGALMSSSTDHDQQLKDEADLKELLLHDLARLHRSPEMSEDDVYNMISNLYLDHYAHDWTHDPNTAGAFAFFRPEQFTNMWNKLVHPSGNLVVIGEAASPHHAWVVGALESAVYGVYSWLQMRTEIKGASDAVDLLKTFQHHNPFVGLPPYMDSTTADWSAVNGRDDLEKYNKKVRGGKIDDSEFSNLLKEIKGNSYSGRGGSSRSGGRSGGRESDAGSRRQNLPRRS